MLQAPLLLGCDLRNLTKETKEIITNTEVIAVNQGIEEITITLPFVIDVTACFSTSLTSLDASRNRSPGRPGQESQK